GTLNFDYIAVRWPAVAEQLSSQNKTDRYDKFKELPLWKNVVGKLSNRSFWHMLDQKSEWFAGSAWGGQDTIRELYNTCHLELYYGVKAVPENDGSGNYKRVPFKSDDERNAAIRAAGGNTDL